MVPRPSLIIPLTVHLGHAATLAVQEASKPFLAKLVRHRESIPRAVSRRIAVDADFENPAYGLAVVGGEVVRIHEWSVALDDLGWSVPVAELVHCHQVHFVLYCMFPVGRAGVWVAARDEAGVGCLNERLNRRILYIGKQHVVQGLNGHFLYLREQSSVQGLD